MHELHMCRIKGKGLGVIGLSSMGMHLGAGWTGGRGIGVERWGVERRLNYIWGLKTVGSVLDSL